MKAHEFLDPDNYALDYDYNNRMFSISPNPAFLEKLAAEHANGFDIVMEDVEILNLIPILEYATDTAVVRQSQKDVVYPKGYLSVLYKKHDGLESGMANIDFMSFSTPSEDDQHLFNTPDHLSAHLSKRLGEMLRALLERDQAEVIENKSPKDPVDAAIDELRDLKHRALMIARRYSANMGVQIACRGCAEVIDICIAQEEARKSAASKQADGGDEDGQE